MAPISGFSHVYIFACDEAKLAGEAIWLDSTRWRIALNSHLLMRSGCNLIVDPTL